MGRASGGDIVNARGKTGEQSGWPREPEDSPAHPPKLPAHHPAKLSGEAVLPGAVEDLGPKPRTVDAVLKTIAPGAARRLAAAGLIPPWPRKIAVVVYKAEARVDVYADDDAIPRFLLSWSITAASGGPGPKRKQGDLQVPEGVYRLDTFNPNSLYHLSLRVNYPNATDRARAQVEGQSTPLGGDIMIHGEAVSIGCVAIGNAAIEELFLLAAKVGLPVPVVIVPWDLRSRPPPASEVDRGAHMVRFYDELRRTLERYPLARSAVDP